jgi:hypothetical protein
VGVRVLATVQERLDHSDASTERCRPNDRLRGRKAVGVQVSLHRLYGLQERHRYPVDVRFDHDPTAVEKPQPMNAPDTRVKELGPLNARIERALGEILKRRRDAGRRRVDEHVAQ